MDARLSPRLLFLLGLNSPQRHRDAEKPNFSSLQPFWNRRYWNVVLLHKFSFAINGYSRAGPAVNHQIFTCGCYLYPISRRTSDDNFELIAWTERKLITPRF